VVPEDRTRVLDQIDPDVRAAVEAGIAGGVYSVGVDAARIMLCNATLDAGHMALVTIPGRVAALLNDVNRTGSARFSPT
jgi:hypothetical protein